MTELPAALQYFVVKVFQTARLAAHARRQTGAMLKRLSPHCGGWLWSVLLFFGLAGLTKPASLCAEEPAKNVSPATPAASAMQFSIEGTCVDEQGHPVPEANVVLLLLEKYSTKPPQKWELKSGPSGKFRFEKLARPTESAPRQKSYFLAVSKSNWTSSYRTIRLDEEAPKGGYQFKLSTKVGVLSGRVLDEHGRPLVGANVYMDCDGGPLPGFRQSTTDAQGRYSIGGMNLWKPGTVEFDPVTKSGAVCIACYYRIKHPNYPLMLASFSGIPEVVDVQATPGITIEGKVIDVVTGKPAVDAVVTGLGVNHEWGDETLT